VHRSWSLRGELREHAHSASQSSLRGVGSAPEAALHDGHTARPGQLQDLYCKRDRGQRPRLQLARRLVIGRSWLTRLFLGPLPKRGFAREFDPALVVYPDAFDPDHVADFNNVFGPLDAEIG
jgi:hypothetical protein